MSQVWTGACGRPAEPASICAASVALSWDSRIRWVGTQMNEETQRQTRQTRQLVAELSICSISSGTFLPPRLFNRARRPECSASYHVWMIQQQPHGSEPVDTNTFSANCRHSSSEPCHAASQCMKRLQPAASPPAASTEAQGNSPRYPKFLTLGIGNVGMTGKKHRTYIAAFCTMLFVCLHAWKCKHLWRRLVRQLRHSSLDAEVGFVYPALGLSQGQRVNGSTVCSVPANQQRSVAPEGWHRPGKHKLCQSNKSAGFPRSWVAGDSDTYCKYFGDSSGSVSMKKWQAFQDISRKASNPPAQLGPESTPSARIRSKISPQFCWACLPWILRIDDQIWSNLIKSHLAKAQSHSKCPLPREAYRSPSLHQATSCRLPVSTVLTPRLPQVGPTDWREKSRKCLNTFKHWILGCPLVKPKWSTRVLLWLPNCASDEGPEPLSYFWVI